MKQYIFGSRKGIYIIDLEKSHQALSQAMDFIVRSTAASKKILFVGTKSQVKGLLKKNSKEVNMPYVSERWIGGLLTNFSVIRKTIRKFKDLTEKKATGQLSKYTKKEQLQFDRQIAKMDLYVGGLVDLQTTPDVIFIWDIKTEKTALAEARKKKIPVIAVCDTNVNPDGVDYVIPANDDASKTIKMILDLAKDAVLEGKSQAEKNQTSKKTK